MVTFTPAKQRGQVRTSKFLIPRGKTQNGVCFATLIDEYLEALVIDEVPRNPTGPLLFTGRPALDTKPSRYINSALGENSLRNVGIDIANFLGLPDAKPFTGHCFRR